MNPAPLSLKTPSGCLVLGITGGVASGKSTLARMLEAFGACRISADEIARDLLAPGSETTLRVLREFGGAIGKADVPDTIDRPALARLIYADDSARRALGVIMHPLIRSEMQARIERCKVERCKLIAAEIPLLYENHLESMVDAVLVAACPERVQLQRLIARQPALSEDDALRQIRSQFPLPEKIARADYLVLTDQSVSEVELQVRELFGQLAVREA